MSFASADHGMWCVTAGEPRELSKAHLALMRAAAFVLGERVAAARAEQRRQRRLLALSRLQKATRDPATLAEAAVRQAVQALRAGVPGREWRVMIGLVETPCIATAEQDAAPAEQPDGVESRAWATGPSRLRWTAFGALGESESPGAAAVADAPVHVFAMQDLVRLEGAGADVEAALGTEVMQALRRLTLQALDTQQAALSDNGSERFPRTADLAMPITCRRPGGPGEATGVIYLYNGSSNRLKVTRASVAVDASAIEFVQDVAAELAEVVQPFPQSISRQLEAQALNGVGALGEAAAVWQQALALLQTHLSAPAHASCCVALLQSHEADSLLRVEATQGAGLKWKVGAALTRQQAPELFAALHASQVVQVPQAGRGGALSVALLDRDMAPFGVVYVCFGAGGGGGAAGQGSEAGGAQDASVLRAVGEAAAAALVVVETRRKLAVVLSMGLASLVRCMPQVAFLCAAFPDRGGTPRVVHAHAVAPAAGQGMAAEGGGLAPGSLLAKVEAGQALQLSEMVADDTLVSVPVRGAGDQIVALLCAHKASMDAIVFDQAQRSPDEQLRHMALLLGGIAIELADEGVVPVRVQCSVCVQYVCAYAGRMYVCIGCMCVSRLRPVCMCVCAGARVH